jgi:hypothetical protein
MPISSLRPSLLSVGAESNRTIDATAAEHATALRREVGVSDELPLTDEGLSRIVALARCEVFETDELGSSTGGAEAMLLPEDGGGFRILVDPRPLGGWGATGADFDASLRRRLRFRVLHEVGHTLFFEVDGGARPRRVGTPTEWEELFCDRLAAALLLPPAAVRAAPARAEAAYSLSERFDVSAHLVARAFAIYHPDVMSVSLVLRSERGLRIQWATDSVAAQAAIDEMAGRGRPPGEVWWAERGAQALRFECFSAAV